MTSEEIHDKVNEWIDDVDKGHSWHYGKTELHRDIDRVIDTVNSRSCSNCTYRMPMGEHENDLCTGSHPIQFAADDFCCNRWEQIDDK